MELFAELGALIENRWRDQNYREELFPGIASQVLSEFNLPDRTDAWQIIRWLHAAVSLPEQIDREAHFGNPPITLFVAPRFYIDIYFWLDGTTSIHQHSFSGAFQVLLGGSVHAHYDFEKLQEINPHFLIGGISLKKVSLLKKGDIREILAGPKFIHSLFHLERPSATITIRTYKAPSDAVQYSYLKPFLARNPFFKDPLLQRKVQTVDLLLRMKHPDADSFITDIIRSSDFQTVYAVLDRSFDFLCHRDLEELVGVTRSRDRFEALLNCAREKYGELADFLLPVFEEEWRQSDIARRRAEIKNEDHRFFLALLLNVPDRPNVLRLMSERFPGQDPVGLIVGWIKELAATKVFGSHEPSVLGIGEFDESHLFVFERLLRGLTLDEIQAEASAQNVHAPIADLTARIQGLPIFKSLFQ
jgi:hypothetical protein